MDRRFGTWNIRSLYRARSLMTVSRELSRYGQDLVRVLKVRWEGCGTKSAVKHTYPYGKRNENNEMGTGILYIRESYQQLRGFNLIVIA
jgi:hypothetical protein